MINLIKFHGEQNFKFDVNEKDTVIKVKVDLCNMLSKKDGLFKCMKFCCKENFMLDNSYLLEVIDKENDIEYKFDIELDTSELMVLKLRIIGNYCLLISVKKSQKISDLKLIIDELVKTGKELFIFYESKLIDKNYETVESNNFDENNEIIVVEKIIYKLEAKDIFSDNCFSLDCCSIDSVNDVKRKVAESLKCTIEDLFLFFNYRNLDQNLKPWLYEYEIDTRYHLYYCQIMSLDQIDIDNELFSHGQSSEIFRATNKENNQKIIIKKYFSCQDQSKNLYSNLIKELFVFMKIRNHPRILQITGVYRDNDSLNVGMEWIDGVSLEDFIKEKFDKKEEIDEIFIANCGLKILQVLECMHDNKILHRNLKASNLFVCNNGDIKISGFSMSKYMMYAESNDLVKGLVQTRTQPFRYQAPEVLKSNPYGVKADVWSFGVVMIYMATLRQPYHEFDEFLAAKKIIEKKKIDYEITDKYSKELKSLIESCVRFNPNERPLIADLLNHDFITKWKLQCKT